MGVTITGVVTPTSNVVILVPRRGGVEDRDRLWAFARRWWENDFPDWRIVEGSHDYGPFNRAAALNRAAAAAGAEWDVAVCIDADVLCDPHAVRAAVDVAAATHRPVLGYHERVHLTEKATQRILAGFDGNWKGPGFVKTTLYDACSSCVVVSRRLWDEVEGFDEAFSGWGWEDVAFRVATETMSGGELIKLAGTIFHLHHKPSHENNKRESTFQANRARGDLYNAARWDRDAMRALIADSAPPEPDELGPTRIPRILHRTIPAAPSKEAEAWWHHFGLLHPGWELRTHQDPLDPTEWPETAHLWERCRSGAQMAGLIRLEAIWRHGGVYVDSDIEPYRSLEPLLALAAFAGWEDAKVVPDAMFGAEPGHPAVRVMLDLAKTAIESGAGAWESGPGVFTATLPGRTDVLLLPPGSLYPYHYSDKAAQRRVDHHTQQPWAFAAHHWNASWVGNER